MSRPRERWLAVGQTVGVVAPGFAVRKAALARGVRRLRTMGYRVRIGRHVLSSDGYLAGADDARAADLNEMIHDPEVRAVWSARGGYGTARILDSVDWRALRRDPKLLIGYSDLTALFNAAARRTGQVCLYGPVVSELGQPEAWHAPSLQTLLAGKPFALRVAKRNVLVPGKASGTLFGGNLSVLTHLCGTRYFPDLRDAVLFLEEIGEETYRIDRMLTQLGQSGAFRGLAGVLLGTLDVPARRRFPTDRRLIDVLRETFGGLGVPVVRGLPVGHRAGKRTLPLGGRATIETAAGRVFFSP